MSSLIDLPTAWDFPSAHKQVIMSGERNFSRPKEPFNLSTMPLDINQVSDTLGPIGQVQVFMRSAPYGIKYDGPANGKINGELIESLKKLELALESRFQHPFQNTIVVGNTVSAAGLAKAIQTVKTLKKNPEIKVEKSEGDQKIKAFQKFFSLPETGKVTPELVSAAKSAEQTISDFTGISASGMLWDDATQNFKTTVADLQSALKIIQSQKK